MEHFATCPHCGQTGIAVGANRYHSRGWPAQCRACGGLAYDRPHALRIALELALNVIGPPLLVLCWVLVPWTFPVCAALGIAFVGWRWWQHRRIEFRRPASLFYPISPGSSLLSRRLTYLAIVAAVLTLGALFFFKLRAGS